MRYVIDFYKGKEKKNPQPGDAPISMYLDVRPALDSVPALFDRMYVGVQEALGETIDSLALKKNPSRTPSSTKVSSSK